MSRSLKKGVFVNEKLAKKIAKAKAIKDRIPIKTWARASTITPDMVGMTFLVHNGKDFVNVLVDENMIGHRLGEFSPTRKFIRHGGKMQKQQRQKRRQRNNFDCMATMTTTARLRYSRMSPRKARLLIDAIRGLHVDEALTQLTFSGKVAARPIIKLLQSSIANAMHNHEMERQDRKST